MKKCTKLFSVFLGLVLLISSISGVFGDWLYAYDTPDDVDQQLDVNLAGFEYKAFEGVQIESVSVYDYKNLTERATEFSFPTDLYSSVRARSGGFITYKVTFYNNSSVNYWFIGSSYEADLANNAMINAQYGITITMKDNPEDFSATFDSNDWIPANTRRDVI